MLEPAVMADSTTAAGSMDIVAQLQTSNALLRQIAAKAGTGVSLDSAIGSYFSGGRI